MAPSEFSAYVPFYVAAMTETPDAYTTETPDNYDPESIYWLFNEIGNGSYYRLDDSGAYHDRYGNEIDAATAEAVLVYLSDSAFIGGLHEYMNSVQEDLNTKAVADDEAIIALARTASDEEVSAMANKLAEENADYIKMIASEKLTEIDEMVDAYVHWLAEESAA